MRLRRHTAVRGLSAVAVACVAAVLAPATGASAAEVPLSVTDQAVADRLATRSLAPALGKDLAGVVTDAATGQVIWAHTPTEAQIPASNAKILTAVNALEAFGPTHTFTTSVMTGSTARRIVLVGGGDPSLSARQLGRMARTTAAAWLAKGVTRVRVEVDDSLFPAPTSALAGSGPTRSRTSHRCVPSSSTTTDGGTPRWTPAPSSPASWRSGAWTYAGWPAPCGRRPRPW
jgi:D-alanyl-D-alanine carboxypeptidase/D-alanyl-D-alanine-endopeptidase (penicillin-binding protein 4)